MLLMNIPCTSFFLLTEACVILCSSHPSLTILCSSLPIHICLQYHFAINLCDIPDEDVPCLFMTFILFLTCVNIPDSGVHLFHAAVMLMCSQSMWNTWLRQSVYSLPVYVNLHAYAWLYTHIILSLCVHAWLNWLLIHAYWYLFVIGNMFFTHVYMHDCAHYLYKRLDSAKLPSIYMHMDEFAVFALYLYV